MSVSHQRTLPGIHPPSKGYLTFTDSLVSGIVAVTFGGALATDPAITALQHGMLTSTPTADRIWTLPTAVVLLSNLTQYTNIDVGDGFEFIVRNLAAAGSGFDITLAVAAGITSDSEANLIITPGQFSKYILRCDDPNPLAGSADFEIFQVDSGASSTPGPAYLTAESPTGAAATAAITPGTPLIIPTTVFGVDANAVGIVNTATNFTVTNAGVYKVDVSWTTASNVVDSTALMHVAVDAVVNTQALGGAFIGLAAGGVTASGAGSLILSLVAGAVLTLFFDATSAGTPIYTASNLTVNIVRIA